MQPEIPLREAELQVLDEMSNLNADTLEELSERVTVRKPQTSVTHLPVSLHLGSASISGHLAITWLKEKQCRHQPTTTMTLWSQLRRKDTSEKG